MSPRALAALLVPLALHALAAAQGEPQVAPLLPGDPAPALKVAEWIQGEPVTEFQKGQPYVVEFWATWCAPCKRSIPHLDELYRRHKPAGLSVIGVSIWERREELGKIRPFVQGMGERMSYTVARDEVAEDDARGSNGFMSVNWMKAAGQDGIPSAFVIDREGRVAWIGHPLTMDEPLSAVMAGNWDVQAAREEFVRQRELDAKKAEIDARIQAALRESDFKAAVALLDTMVALDPELALRTAARRFDWLLKSKDLDAAYGWARQALEGEIGKDASVLNAIAWMIVDPARADLERRDLELALAAARKADTASEHKDPNVIDTLARVHFLKGELDQALALQEQAVGLATTEAQKASLGKTLEEYRKAAGGQGG